MNIFLNFGSFNFLVVIFFADFYDDCKQFLFLIIELANLDCILTIFLNQMLHIVLSNIHCMSTW